MWIIELCFVSVNFLSIYLHGFCYQNLFIISRLLSLSWSYKDFDFIHHCIGYKMGNELHALQMNCNEMSMQFMPFECVMKWLFLYWVWNGYVIRLNVVYFYKNFGFLFFILLGMKWVVLAWQKNDLGMKCVMKFMPFEWIGICTLCSLTR